MAKETRYAIVNLKAATSSYWAIFDAGEFQVKILQLTVQSKKQQIDGICRYPFYGHSR